MERNVIMNKPNVVFLIQDQMQQQILRSESGCIMPNVQELMKDSVNFNKAYTCNAICSPSRASLITGTLPHVHGMIDCTHTVPSYRAEYDDSLDTITQAFKDGGYHVSYFGKWHIERTHQLEKFGIDTYKTERDFPVYPVTMDEKVKLSTPEYEDRLVCGVFEEGLDHTEEHFVFEEALNDIEQSRKTNKPFCTFISTYAPHDPYAAPREIYDMYEDVELELPNSFYDSMMDKPNIYRRMRSTLSDLTEDDFIEAMRCYYSYCTLVDLQVKKLVSYLKNHDLYDNTIIVFMADHGDYMGAHGLMMKSVPAFEEVYNIPLMMKLPNQEKAGMEAEFYINTYEIAPTVLELAGARALRDQRTGLSMVPWINGNREDTHYAFAEFFGQRYSYTQRIYWEDNLKYVFNAFDDDELYDLEKDPDELINLNKHSHYQKKKIEMCKRMWERIKESGDSSLADAEYYLMRFAPVGPGEKEKNDEYSVYNKNL